MGYEIQLTKSVWGIHFGSAREKVRSKLGPDYQEFRKNKFSQNTADAYKDYHVYYTPDNKLAAVEFFCGAEITIAGRLFKWEYHSAKAWILSMDPKARISEDEITSIVNGISMYVQGGKIETVLFATAEYFS